MNVEQALDIAHQARRTVEGACSSGYCTHCAAILLATEVRRQQAEVRQLRILLDAEKGNGKVAERRCSCCNWILIDGLCGHCDC